MTSPNQSQGGAVDSEVITALRGQGYGVGQDQAGLYRWRRAGQTSAAKAPTEGDAWAYARTHHNLTRGLSRPLI